MIKDQFIRRYFVIQNWTDQGYGMGWHDFESHKEYESDVLAMVRIQEYERGTRQGRDRPDTFRIDCRYDLEPDKQLESR